LFAHERLLLGLEVFGEHLDVVAHLGLAARVVHPSLKFTLNFLLVALHVVMNRLFLLLLAGQHPQWIKQLSLLFASLLLLL